MTTWDDLPFVETEIRIGAPAETVWGLMTDLDRWGMWSPEFEGGEWGPEGPVSGGTLVGHNRRGDFTWTTTSQVVAAEPGRTLAWEVLNTGAPPGSTWRIDIEPAGDGVLVRHSVQLGPGPSGLTRALEKYPERADEIKQRRAADLRAGMEQVLTGLKAAAESG